MGAAADAAATKRRALGLTQRGLAALADVSQRSVQYIETGKGTVQLDVLSRVLDALGLALVVMPRSAGQRLEQESAAAVVRPSARPSPTRSPEPSEPRS